jgi:hypothetical protein
MEEKKTKPHLFNLNFDPQLSGRLGRRRLLNVGSVKLGKKKYLSAKLSVGGIQAVRNAYEYFLFLLHIDFAEYLGIFA